MTKFRNLLLALLLATISGCNQHPDNIIKNFPMTDPHSFASQGDAIMQHLHLDLAVDFDRKVIHGSAEITLQNDYAEKLVLDTRQLKIDSVEDGKGNPLEFELGNEVEYLGRALTIKVKTAGKKVKVFYSTIPGSDALQWLEPGQTAGKKFPFLFSQSQAILARTWVPVQDSPGIRFTYSARVRVPAGMMALMSAENPLEKNHSGQYNFTMPQPIPAYLLAIAVGDLGFKSFDQRSGVFAEPVTLQAASYEFEELPSMISAAEKLYGPYRWGRYDLLVLPPSFPFGGMENPRLTFCTPTILAGDRSLTSLVAHELAHSWSGNLVTNATWNDFWLNEGFTVYFENRIMEEIYGAEFSNMQKLLGQEDLRETVHDLGINSEDTKLRLKLDGRDPDEGMNDVAYEKGCNLLLLIEKTIGREKLDRFLKNYFSKYAFKTISTDQFIDEYYSGLVKKGSKEDNDISIVDWIDQPGIPVSMVKVESEKFTFMEKQAADFMRGVRAGSLKMEKLSTYEWLRFLRSLKKPLTVQQVKELDAAFHFSATGNSEILFEWFDHAIAADYREAFPALENFLVHVGRRKFVKPLFKSLVKTEAGKKTAGLIFQKARPNYHSVTAHTVEQILTQ